MTPEIQASHLFYFFSTVAQVWAALVAFGGIAMRDRILRLDESRHRLFAQIEKIVHPLADALGVDYWDDCFMNRERLSKFMEERGNFEKEINVFRANRGSRGYSRPFGGGRISENDILVGVRMARQYHAGYKADEKLQKEIQLSMGSFLAIGISIIWLASQSLLKTYEITATGYCNPTYLIGALSILGILIFLESLLEFNFLWNRILKLLR